MSMLANFRQLSLLLLVIEKLATTHRLRTLHFFNAIGQAVGAVKLEGGMVVSGIRVDDTVFIDEEFKRDTVQVAVPLRKLLHNEPLAAEEIARIQAVSLLARRALGQLMARALRRLASHADLTQIRIEDHPPGADAQSRALRFAFPPVEVLLAAGRSGRRRETDKATSLYDMPPEPVEERWLFEWQADSPGEAWPIMTSRQAEKKTNTVAQFGFLGQSLVQRFGHARREGDPIGVTAELAVTELHLYYAVLTDRYVTLLVYQTQHIDRVLRSLQDVVFDAPSIAKAPRPPAAVGMTDDKLARATGQPAAEPIVTARLDSPRTIDAPLAGPAAMSGPVPISEPISVSGPVPISDPIPIPVPVLVSEPVRLSKPAPIPAPASTSELAPIPETVHISESVPTSGPIPISEQAAISQAVSVPEPISGSIPISGPVLLPEATAVPEPIPEPVPEPIPISKTIPISKSLANGDSSQNIGPAAASRPHRASDAAEAPLLAVRGVRLALTGSPPLALPDLALGRRGLHALVGASRAVRSALLSLLAGQSLTDPTDQVTGALVYHDGPLGEMNHPTVLAAPIARSQLSLRAYLLSGLPPAAATDTKDHALHDVLDRTRLSPFHAYLNDPLEGRTLRLFPSEWLRLALARQLLGNPAMICLDDPTVGMHVADQDVLWSVLREEAKLRAILVLLHDAEEAEYNGAEVHPLLPQLASPAPLDPDATVAVSTGAQTDPLTMGRDPREVIWATPIPVLRLRDFSIRVSGRTVLSQVNLDLADHGLHVLVGPDNTRRRTFLRAVCGPRGNQIELDGQFIFGGASIRKERGLSLPSTEPRHALLSVVEYLSARPQRPSAETQAESAAYVAGLLHGARFPEMAQRMNVAFCELEPYERRVVEILSVAATQPLAMVLHDVLHGLPSDVRPRILTLLATQAAQHAILLCTHDPQPYLAFPFAPPLRVAYFDNLSICPQPPAAERVDTPTFVESKPSS